MNETLCRGRAHLVSRVSDEIALCLAYVRASRNVTETAVVEAALRRDSTAPATRRSCAGVWTGWGGPSSAHRDVELVSEGFSVIVRLWFA